ncbi:hypothetical protein NXS19_009497 [Fusarium pseudograminearum]|nr:hypothetical protein NXS19_009497 [Fusarium pseudograminearum]
MFCILQQAQLPAVWHGDGRECYCGYAPKTQATVAPDGDCKMPCTGDSTQKCGAGNRISIWNNTMYTPTVSTEGVNSPPKYLGCYTEGVEARALGDAKTTDKKKMTVEICAAFCSSKGYPYLGVQNGQDCYCSKKGPSNGSVEAPASQCGMTCKGDKKQKCGATKRLNVYKLARVSKTSSTTKSTVKVAAAKVQGQKPASKSTTLLKATAANKSKPTPKTKTTSTTKPKTSPKSNKVTVQRVAAKATTTAKSKGETKAKNKRPTTTTSSTKSRKTKRARV